MGREEEEARAEEQGGMPVGEEAAVGHRGEGTGRGMAVGGGTGR